MTDRARIWRVAALVGAGLSALACGRAEPTLPLATVAIVPLPGAATRFDYESLDPKTGRLYIAHLAASEVVVFDVRTNRVVGTIGDVESVHGVLAVPELGRVYATATGTSELAVIDARSLKILARVPAGTYPDGIAFDPTDRRLYVSDEHGDTETVIDAMSSKRVATIPLGGDIGNSQYDRRSRRVYVNVQTTGELVAIDPARNAVVGRYPVPGCSSNHGLQLDDARQRAYIACEANARLVVFDLRIKKVTQSVHIGDDPDVLALDAANATLYVAAESGTVSMLTADLRGLTKVGEGFLATNAHVVAVDPGTRRVYFPVLSDAGPKLMVMRRR